MEKWLMNLTDKRWKKKTKKGKVNAHGATMAMITDPHFCKPDPEIFQSKVLQQYEYKVRQLLEINVVHPEPAGKQVSL
jgi:hypothetical protein